MPARPARKQSRIRDSWWSAIIDIARRVGGREFTGQGLSAVLEHRHPRKQITRGGAADRGRGDCPPDDLLRVDRGCAGRHCRRPTRQVRSRKVPGARSARSRRWARGVRCPDFRRICRISHACRAIARELGCGASASPGRSGKRVANQCLAPCGNTARLCQKCGKNRARLLYLIEKQCRRSRKCDCIVRGLTGLRALIAGPDGRANFLINR